MYADARVRIKIALVGLKVKSTRLRLRLEGGRVDSAIATLDKTA